MPNKIYVIGHPGSSIAKIGMSRGVEVRLKELQRDWPVELQILWTCDGDRAMELALHRRFADLRVHGEWFEFPDDPVGHVREAIAAGLPAVAQAGDPFQSGKPVAVTKARATYAAVRARFGDRIFTADDVVETLGLTWYTGRSHVTALIRSGFFIRADFAEFPYRGHGCVEGAFIARPMPASVQFGPNRRGARIPEHLRVPGALQSAAPQWDGSGGASTMQSGKHGAMVVTDDLAD